MMFCLRDCWYQGKHDFEQLCNSYRDMRKETFQQKGLPYVSQLAMENCQALKAIIQWNHENGIRFFRYMAYVPPDTRQPVQM